jgi:hypothetical protein
MAVFSCVKETRYAERTKTMLCEPADERRRHCVLSNPSSTAADSGIHQGIHGERRAGCVGATRIFEAPPPGGTTNQMGDYSVGCSRVKQQVVHRREYLPAHRKDSAWTPVE